MTEPTGNSGLLVCPMPNCPGPVQRYNSFVKCEYCGLTAPDVTWPDIPRRSEAAAEIAREMRDRADRINAAHAGKDRNEHISMRRWEAQEVAKSFFALADRIESVAEAQVPASVTTHLEKAREVAEHLKIASAAIDMRIAKAHLVHAVEALAKLVTR